ncbi:hypothetical protein HHK36_023978 [Tetracentron sinense]|uniref:Uncharacterized protein n=1 Tax=Tetracentron sinense TaxID=13715 RepID=A0A834YU56_TETSI|nr:hypothetical protein HHK36_023978 [Tetracentron sinense]
MNGFQAMTLAIKKRKRGDRNRREEEKATTRSGKYSVSSMIFDEKNNTVTIVGPFCPNKMAKKLSCKAGKLIISIEEKKEPEKPKPNNPPLEKPADKPPKAPETASKVEPSKPPVPMMEPAPKAPVPGYPLAPVYSVLVYPVPAYPFDVCC